MYNEKRKRYYISCLSCYNSCIINFSRSNYYLCFIITKAQETAKVSEQATIRDAVSNAQAECMMEYYDASITTKTPAVDLIKKYVPSDWQVTATTAPTITEGVIAKSESGSVTVKAKSYTHTVTILNGVVTTITATVNSN